MRLLEFFQSAALATKNAKDTFRLQKYTPVTENDFRHFVRHMRISTAMPAAQKDVTTTFRNLQMTEFAASSIGAATSERARTKPKTRETRHVEPQKRAFSNRPPPCFHHVHLQNINVVTSCKVSHAPQKQLHHN